MKFLKKAYSDAEAQVIVQESETLLNDLTNTLSLVKTLGSSALFNPMSPLRVKMKLLLKQVVSHLPLQMLTILMEKKEIPSSKERVALGKIKTLLSKKSYSTDDFSMFQSVFTEMITWWKTWKDIDMSAEEGEDFFKVKDIRVRVTSKITPALMVECKEIIEKAVEFINKSNLPRFKEMLKNLQIFIVGGKKTSTIAYYNRIDDFVYLQHQYIKSEGIEDSVHSVIHELGHRYLNKIATDSQKTEWKSFYKDIQSKQWSSDSAKFYPQVGDSLSKDFKVNTKHKYPLDVVKEVRFEPMFGETVLVLESGGMVSRAGFRKTLGFPTTYSSDSQDEFFCETLALIHMKKLKPLYADVKAKFLEIWQGGTSDDDIVVYTPPTKTPEVKTTPKVVVVPPTPVTYTEPTPPKTRKPRTPKAPVPTPTPVPTPVPTPKVPVAPVFTPSAPVVQQPSPTGSKFNPYADIPTYLSRFEKTLAKIKMTKDSSTEWETKFMANMIKMLKQNIPYTPKQLLWIEKTLQKYSI